MRSSGPFFAALDYGTGGAKCAIFDGGGKRLAIASAPWDYEAVSHEHAHLSPGALFDPQAFWRSLSQCCRRAVAEAGIPSSQIAAVASTAQRLGTVFLDAQKREIYAAPNRDGRGLGGGFEIMETLDLARTVGITGHWPPMVFSLARLLAFRKLPDSPPVAHILTLNDWMTFRLSGALTSEASNAGESMLLDVSSRTWSRELLDTFEIDERLLPPLCEPGTQVGGVTQRAAEETGLAVGTPVVAGGADTQCALLGASVVETDHAAAVLGTTTPVMLAESSPRFDLTGRLWTGCHVLPDRWTVESNAGDTGMAFAWLLEILGLEGENAYREAARLISETPPAAQTVMEFAGPQIFDLMNFDPHRPATFLIENPSYGARPTRGSFIRGFLSNVVCATRANLDQIETLRDRPTASITLAGGMTRLDALLTEFQRFIPVPLRVTEEPHATALGAAILAAVGCGAQPDIAQAMREMVRTRPLGRDTEFSDEADSEYARWKTRYHLLGKLSA